MEKLSEALNKLDELAVKMDGIMGVSFLLWESIDEGSDRVKVDIHGSAAYFLHDEITAIHDALHDIGDLLSDGLKEVRA